MLKHNLSDYSINNLRFDQYEAHFHILYVHGAWDGVTQELEEMDDFKTYFDSTYTVITTTFTFMMTQQQHALLLEGWHN